MIWLFKPDLAVGEHDRELGARQATVLLASLRDLLFIRQELERRVEFAGLLQDANHVHVLVEALRGIRFERADRLALQVVVPQHQRRHVVGHLHQQIIARAAAELAGQHLGVEQDLDVDFDVRAVDAGGIVDEVGIEASAR